MCWTKSTDFRCILKWSRTITLLHNLYHATTSSGTGIIKDWDHQGLGSSGIGTELKQDRNHHPEKTSQSTAPYCDSVGLTTHSIFLQSRLDHWTAPLLPWRCRLPQEAQWSGNSVMMSLPRHGGWWVWPLTWLLSALISAKTDSNGMFWSDLWLCLININIHRNMVFISSSMIWTLNVTVPLS